MDSFKNNVAFITGGTSGIGRAAAVAFARRGASVVITGRRAEEGAKTVELIQQAGGKGLFVRSDVASEADVQNAVAAAVKQFGKINFAFNNAGIELFEPLANATPDTYRRVFDTNVLGVLLAMKHEVAAMLTTGGGSIVNTSSVAGQLGFSGAAIYSASKHAVEGLTKSAALEYAKLGIRVNGVAPAAIQTDMVDRAFGAGESETKQSVKSMHPVGRLGTVEEVADAVVWLSSPAASFVTGQNLAIDGGFTAQ